MFKEPHLKTIADMENPGRTPEEPSPNDPQVQCPQFMILKRLPAKQF